MTESQQPEPTQETPPPPAWDTQAPPTLSAPPPSAQQGQPAAAAQGMPNSPAWGSHEIPPKEPSSLGRTAFILAMIGLVTSCVLSLLLPIFYSGMDVAQITAFNVFSQILRGALGTTILIVGIIAAAKRAQPVRSGIAIGIGALMIAEIVTAISTSLMYMVIY